MMITRTAAAALRMGHVGDVGGRARTPAAGRRRAATGTSALRRTPHGVTYSAAAAAAAAAAVSA